jgi:hypothetical protein
MNDMMIWNATSILIQSSPKMQLNPTSTAAANDNNAPCSVHDASNAATTARLFNGMNTGSTTRQSLKLTNATGKLIILILSILFIPISIVISLIGVVVAIILIPALLLLVTQIPKDDDNAEIIFIIIAAGLFTAVFLPIPIVLGVFATIVDILKSVWHRSFLPILPRYQHG